MGKSQSHKYQALDLAERVGFEPTVDLRPRLISSQVHSTTLPPLRGNRKQAANYTRAGISRVLPAIYGASALGTVTLPSAC